MATRPLYSVNVYVVRRTKHNFRDRTNCFVPFPDDPSGYYLVWSIYKKNCAANAVVEMTRELKTFFFKFGKTRHQRIRITLSGTIQLPLMSMKEVGSWTEYENKTFTRKYHRIFTIIKWNYRTAYPHVTRYGTHKACTCNDFHNWPLGESGLYFLVSKTLPLDLSWTENIIWAST